MHQPIVKLITITITSYIYTTANFIFNIVLLLIILLAIPFSILIIFKNDIHYTQTYVVIFMLYNISYIGTIN